MIQQQFANLSPKVFLPQAKMPNICSFQLLKTEEFAHPVHVSEKEPYGFLINSDYKRGHFNGQILHLKGGKSLELYKDNILLVCILVPFKKEDQGSGPQGPFLN